MPTHSLQIRALAAAVAVAASGTVGLADASAHTVAHSKSPKVTEQRKAHKLNGQRKAHKVTEHSKDARHGATKTGGWPTWLLSKDPFATLAALTPATPQAAPTSSVSTPSVSTSSVSTPAITTPNVSTSSVLTPTITTASVSTPSVSTPSVSTPTITTSSVATPTITTPSVSTPTITTPSVTTPTITTPSVTTPTPTTSTPTTTVSTPTPTTPSSSTPVPTGVGGNWNISFDDEFNETSLDQSVWSEHDGWNNQNGVTDQSSNISLSGGYANLTLSSSTSGAAISTYSALLGVGDFAEARVYMPGSGSSMYDWDAFWSSGPAWPAAGENDVTESLGGDSTVNYHSPSGAHNQGVISGSWGGAFHIYGIYRGTNYVNVYRDGVLVSSYGTDDDGEAQTLIFTVGNGQGDPVVTGSASTLKIDYLRVWTPA